jgi:hypothetical protein
MPTRRLVPICSLLALIAASLIAGSGRHASAQTTGWVSRAPMPTARGNLGVAAGADGLIYAIGGFATQPVATVEAYNPVANVWQEATSLPHPTVGPGVTVNPDGGIVVVGGFDGQNYLGSTYIGRLSPAHPNSSRVRSRRAPRQAAHYVLTWTFEQAGEQLEHNPKDPALAASYMAYNLWIGL